MYRNIGRVDLRLSCGKLPTAKVAVLSAIFRHTAEINNGKTEAIFGQLPTNTWVSLLAIFRQIEKNRAHTDFSLMISEFRYDGLG